MIDLTQLKAELVTDPENLGYAGKTAAEKVALINAALDGITFPSIVPVATILQVIGMSPFRAAALEEPTRTGWLESLANIRSLKEGLIPSDAGVAALLTQAVSDGVLTSQEKAAIDALGVRAGSRAEQLWGAGSVVALNDVALVI
jgi:hypothetical protein